jgi:phospholipid transport system substrate-binding protein
MRFLHKFFRVGLALFLAGALSRTAAADELSDAEALISGLLADAKASLSAKVLAPADRGTVLRAFLLRYGDMNLLSQEILGHYWSKASPEQREAFNDLLINYFVGSYADRISDFPQDETITVTGHEPPADGHILLHSIAVNGSEQTPVDWVIQRTGEGRLVIADAMVEGVSPLKAMKSEFTAVIRANGDRLDALLDVLRQKVASYGVHKTGLN